MFKSQFYRTEGTGFPAGPETIGGGGGGGGRGGGGPAKCGGGGGGGGGGVAEGETATTKI